MVEDVYHYKWNKQERNMALEIMRVRAFFGNFCERALRQSSFRTGKSKTLLAALNTFRSNSSPTSVLK